MIRYCRNPGVVCPPEDSENKFVGNFTSEAEDEILFYYKRYKTYSPPLGSPWTSNTTEGEGVGPTPQDAGDDADNDATDGEAGNTPSYGPNPGYRPEDPEHFPPTIPKIPEIFWNEEQVCAWTCPDGSTFSYTIPAHTFNGLSLAAANAYAYGRACSRAAQARLCISNLSGSETVCVGGSSYRYFSVSGGNPPFDVEIEDGAVPPGMIMVQSTPTDFLIYGTPNTPGEYTITFRVTDALGNQKLKTFTFKILGVTTNTVPDGNKHDFYSTTLQYDGPVSGPVTWSLISGSLPTGLSLESSTGTLSGTIESGPACYTFTASFTDGANTCAKEFTMRVTDTAGVFWGMVWNVTANVKSGSGATSVSGGGNSGSSDNSVGAWTVPPNNVANTVLVGTLSITPSTTIKGLLAVSAFNTYAFVLKVNGVTKYSKSDTTEIGTPDFILNTGGVRTIEITQSLYVSSTSLDPGAETGHAECSIIQTGQASPC